MSDARWLEIDGDVVAASEHFARATEIYRVGGFDASGLEGYKARMAPLHAMQAGHTSMESALVRVLDLLGEQIPSGRDWHADLIRRVARAVEGRPAILPADLAAAADETRRFRHVAMRSYDSLDPARAQPAIDAAGILGSSLVAAMAALRPVIDPGT